MTVCSLTDWSLPVLSVHVINQARVLEWGHSLLQRLFSTQRSNLCLLHWQMDSLPTVPPGAPHEQRSPAGYSQWGLRVEHDWATNTFSIINYPDIPCLPKSLVNTNNVVNFTLIYAVYVDALSCILPCSLLCVCVCVCVCACVCVSCLVMSDSWQPHRLQPPRLLHPWNPGKTTRVGCHFLLQLPIVTIPYWSYGCQ